MTLDEIRIMLGWSAIINLGILLWWVFFITFANDWVYSVHSKFLKVERRYFDAIHYAGLAVFKIAIFMLNIVPYLALRIIG